MTPPTYAWNIIATGQTDADSPINATLMDSYRENLVHLEEWLGDSYVAAKDHDHDGVNSKEVTPPDYAAGDVLLANSEDEETWGTSTFTKLKAFIVPRSGELRIKFDAKDGGAGSGHARIYKNGVAEGTNHVVDSSSYATLSQDISGWSAGDSIELWVEHVGDIFVKNFRLYSDEATEIVNSYPLAAT